MLTAIIGYTDLSLRRVSLEDPLRRNLEETRKAAERAASLVRQLRTVFRDYLPRLDDEDMTNEELPQELIEPQGLETILLVEDDVEVRVMIQRLLEELGYKVISTENGRAALAASRASVLERLMATIIRAR